MSDIIQFGKHKGKTWAEVPEGYLNWAKGQEGRLKEQAEAELARRNGTAAPAPAPLAQPVPAAPVASPAPPSPDQMPKRTEQQAKDEYWENRNQIMARQTAQNKALEYYRQNSLVVELNEDFRKVVDWFYQDALLRKTPEVTTPPDAAANPATPPSTDDLSDIPF